MGERRRKAKDGNDRGRVICGRREKQVRNGGGERAEEKRVFEKERERKSEKRVRGKREYRRESRRETESNCDEKIVGEEKEERREGREKKRIEREE
ncbi:hypothetical protein Tco_1430174 [Tanacetum coccineum]